MSKIYDKYLHLLFIIYFFEALPIVCTSEIIMMLHSVCITTGAGIKIMQSLAKPNNCNNQNVPSDPIKKMNIHMVVFCPLIRKLKAFENLKCAQRSLWRKQRTSHLQARRFYLLFCIFTSVIILFPNTHYAIVYQCFPLFN